MISNNRSNTKGYSIRIRVVLALFALVAVQGLILLCSIAFTGAIKKNDIAIYDILSNQSFSRRIEIQEELNNNRKNITNASLELNDKILRTLDENKTTVNMLAENSAVFNEILTLSLIDLIGFTKYNGVTGVFIILDPTAHVGNETKASRTSVYLRDSSPDSVSGNNSNLLLEYGRVDIARREGIAVDYMWTRDMDFSGGYNRDFYYKPVKAALEIKPGRENPQICGYWSQPFRLKKDGVSVITYSLPLISDDGSVYGVMGFELDINYVGNMIKPNEIPYKNSFYLIGVDSGEGLYNDSVISSGAYANQFMAGKRAAMNKNLIYEGGKSPVYEINSSEPEKRNAVGAFSEIGLYETHSPFYNEKWMIVCMGLKSSIMSGSISIKNSIIVSIISTVLLAFVLSVFMTFFITDPIHRLFIKIKKIDPEKPVRFDKTNIIEIDELAGAFEVLSDRVTEIASKMFKIIELVDMPLGSFEVNHKKHNVRLSGLLFDLLNLEKPQNGSGIISSLVWSNALNTLIQKNFTVNDEDITEVLYMTDMSWPETRWFKMRIITEDTRDIGVVIDVTDEIARQQKLEYESSYDSLSGLLNRKAFMDKADEIISSEPDKVALMMFADLDDLKFVNDMYGHESGDKYIKAFAFLLSKCASSPDSAAGRISGDEFVMLLGGFSSHSDAKKAFDNMILGLKDTSITIFEGVAHRLKASIGLSYYPTDSRDISELVKYADYAMYEIKHSVKDAVKEFDINDYNRNSFALKMKDTLDRMISERKACFAFQPIVNVKTGDVFAYECLMRSEIRELRFPADILRAAHTQSKLYQIEKLTFDIALNWIFDNAKKIDSKKIFINSIPGQIFSESDMEDIRERYGHLSGIAVFEIAENELNSQEDAINKVGMLKDFGSMIAIDDYSAGHSHELALSSIAPDFLKIDMGIVRNIDEDNNKHQLAKDIIGYAARKGIRVIAEGVETRSELQALVALGVDFAQGYYLARPSFEVSDITEDLKNELRNISHITN